MQHHPHIHYVVAGGGLANDRDRWIAPRGDFLVHVKALSAVFRGTFKDELAGYGLLESVPEDVWRKNRVVHCKSVGDGQRVLTFLGAYVLRVAISHARIIEYDGKSVTFKYYKVGSRRARTCTLDVLEFIRRYLQHALPKGFAKIRHYGFLHSKCSVGMEQLRELIAAACDQLRKLLRPKPPEKFKPLTFPSAANNRFIIGFRRIASSP